MAKLQENSFSTYLLDDEEVRQGTMLTITQRQHIQNSLATVAETILGLKYDSNEPEKYREELIYNQGALSAYQHIIDSSDCLQATQEADALANSAEEANVDIDISTIFCNESDF